MAELHGEIRRGEILLEEFMNPRVITADTALRMGGDAHSVFTVYHLPALNKPALVSPLLKKSSSNTCRPILACSEAARPMLHWRF
jgi:hypothetical protein